MWCYNMVFYKYIGLYLMVSYFWFFSIFILVFLYSFYYFLSWMMDFCSCGGSSFFLLSFDYLGFIWVGVVLVWVVSFKEEKYVMCLFLNFFFLLVVEVLGYFYL